ncbi:MAG: hypothetical protein LLG97_12345, partial [Deltaproteobacteria bacterium]|nr:hypothetical protein [Deltaproteobacteria bacterium]
RKTTQQELTWIAEEFYAGSLKDLLADLERRASGPQHRTHWGRRIRIAMDIDVLREMVAGRKAVSA